MLNFNFMLNAGAELLGAVLPIALVVAFFYFFVMRPQKKQRQEDAAMRDSLAVGDEITTIGGIIGKVVSIKEDTFVIETTKDKTKIRFLRGALRSIDVKIADVAAAQAAEKVEAQAEKAETPVENTEAQPETTEAPAKKKKAK